MEKFPCFSNEKRLMENGPEECFVVNGCFCWHLSALARCLPREKDVLKSMLGDGCFH